MDHTDVLSAEEIEAAGLADWRHVGRALRTRYDTASYAAALALVARIGAAAEAADHHPDIDLRHGWVGLALSSHDVDGITGRDLRLARTISELAAAAGHPARPASPAVLTVCIDTVDRRAICPFWEAALGVAADPEGWALVDPSGQLPVLWFQPTDEPRPQRNRIHLDLYVPAELAEARVAAALAAGGRLVSERFAPSWWILADAEGNELCICTSQEPANRDSP